MGVYAVDKLIAETRRLAAEYRRTTGQPLPVSAEIASHDAARLLDLELIQPPPGGYDAVGRSGDLHGKRVQIKGRAIFDEAKSGQRIGQLKVEQDWDCVLLVLMDENYETFAIYAADRRDILEELQRVEQSNRAKRGLMSVAKFKNISQLIWSREEGTVSNALWDNQQE